MITRGLSNSVKGTGLHRRRRPDVSDRGFAVSASPPAADLAGRWVIPGLAAVGAGTLATLGLWLRSPGARVCSYAAEG